MKMATFTLVGISPYSQSRYVTEPKLDRELADAYEKRTWQKRMHVDEKGEIFIPPMSLKNCLSECAKFLGMKVRGSGKATYTKHFEAGVMCTDPIKLGVKAEQVQGEWLFLPSDGKRGSGSRVPKCMPRIDPPWVGTAQVLILDDIIDEEVFVEHLTKAGQFIGLGRFRPRNNGFYGRFRHEGLNFGKVE